MESRSSNNNNGDEEEAAPRRPRTASKAALLALLLLVQLATSLYQLPLVRLIERRLCSDFYSDKSLPPPHRSTSTGGIDESLCKVDNVQQRLAWILGAMETAWIVGDFVMAIPLGFIAERYGQKAVLWLNLIPRLFMLAWAPVVGLGFGESLPISAVILGPCLSFLGGDCVFGSITYSLAAGSTDSYIARASLFGYMSSVSYVTNLLGPGLASATMGTKLWLPFVLGICLLLLAIPTVNLLPGTKAHNSRERKHTPSRDAMDSEQQPFLPSSPLLKAARAGGDTNNRAHAHSTTPAAIQNIFSRTKAHIHALSTTFFSSDPSSNAKQANNKNLLLLLASFLLTALASSDTKLLPQYVSKRYGWRLVDVGYLLSCKAVVNFVLLVFVVPRILRRSRQRHGAAGHGEQDNLQNDVGNDNRVPYAQDDDRGIFSSAPHVGISQADARAETRTNISHARICLCISLLGAVLIASAGSVGFLFPALGIYALGSALPVFTLSLLKSPFIVPVPGPASTTPTSVDSASTSSASAALTTSDPREIAQSRSGNTEREDRGDTTKTTTAETQLFALVMMTKTLGSLMGAPLMATLWVRGISLGGAALGIPYIVSGACYAAAIGVFAFIEV